MAKQGIGKREDKAQRRLTKARLKLEVAQAERDQVQVRVGLELERAQKRADRWLARANARVERRARDMSQVEAQYLASSAQREHSELVETPQPQ